MHVEREREIRRRRARRNKTKKLKQRLEKSASTEEKAKILDKLRKVNPFLKLN